MNGSAVLGDGVRDDFRAFQHSVSRKKVSERELLIQEPPRSRPRATGLGLAEDPHCWLLLDELPEHE